MASQITATLPTLNFPREVDYPTQEDWAAFSAAAELNFGILGGGWSTQMQLWKTEANAMSTELNNNADLAQSIANYQGDWTSKGYTLGQSVSVSGIYYICKLTHATGQNPTAGGSLYWNLALGNWNLKVDKVTSTDNAIVRFNGATGQVQNSGVVIDDNGNVGIGIGSPTYRCDVNGHIKSGYIGQDGGYVFARSSDNVISSAITLNSSTQILDYHNVLGVGVHSFRVNSIEKFRIDSSGNALVTGSGGLGYGPGAGGIVTQLTSKGTAVTLNKPTGQIITAGDALAGNTAVAFSFNNNLLEVGDNVYPTVDRFNYRIIASQVNAGSCTIVIENRTAGSLSQSLVINFQIIKGAIL